MSSRSGASFIPWIVRPLIDASSDVTEDIGDARAPPVADSVRMEVFEAQDVAGILQHLETPCDGAAVVPVRGLVLANHNSEAIDRFGDHGVQSADVADARLGATEHFCTLSWRPAENLARAPSDSDECIGVLSSARRRCFSSGHSAMTTPRAGVIAPRVNPDASFDESADCRVPGAQVLLPWHVDRDLYAEFHCPLQSPTGCRWRWRLRAAFPGAV